jgi:hypothetical protein
MTDIVKICVSMRAPALSLSSPSLSCIGTGLDSYSATQHRPASARVGGLDIPRPYQHKHDSRFSTFCADTCNGFITRQPWGLAMHLLVHTYKTGCIMACFLPSHLRTPKRHNPALNLPGTSASSSWSTFCIPRDEHVSIH